MQKLINLKFDLKKPCDDCPFRKDAKWHGGVFKDLEMYLTKAKDKELVHTCHKTDPRSDSPVGQRNQGDVQHCAGLLLMMHQHPRSMGRFQLAAWLKKEWNRDAMDTTIKVFRSLREMGQHYVRLAKKKLKDNDSERISSEIRTDDGLTIRFHRSPRHDY